MSNYLLLRFSARVNGPLGVRTNAPVVFGVGAGTARFLAGPRTQPTFSTRVAVRSDTNGHATAWLLLPVDFNLTNRLTVTAGTGSNSVTAQVAGWLYDWSGTGQLATNTNSLPMPLALEAQMHWINRHQMPVCTSPFELLSFSVGGADYLDTNLFLFPTGHTNDTTYLTLVNTVSNATYQLVWKLDLNTETNWHPGEIITGNGTNVDFAPVPAYGQQKMFFAVVTNPETLVWIDFVDEVVNAREPDPDTNGTGGLGVTLRMNRTGPTDDPLTVYFTRTGTARFTNDYFLTATVPLTNSITIPADSSEIEFVVDPTTDGVVEFDESVVLVLLTTGEYMVDTNFATAALFIENNPPTNFFTTVVAANVPVGIDYHPGTNALIVSVDPTGTEPHSFLALRTNVMGQLVVTNWSLVSGLTEEVKLAIVPTTTNGFTQGEMFFGTGVNGRVGKVSADGTVSNLTWTTLSPTNGTSTLLRGSLYVDRTGIFSNNLIVVTGSSATEGGEVWQIDSTTNGVLLANLANSDFPHLEGVITLAGDSLKWGPWAGKIVTGAESENPPRTYTIATDGVVSTNLMGIAPEDFDLIPKNQDLYCAIAIGLNPRIDKLSQNWLTNFVGDLVITQAGEAIGFPQGLFIMHWDSTNFLFFSTRVSPGDPLEHVTFAPIKLP